jgi:hypothetical protein
MAPARTRAATSVGKWKARSLSPNPKALATWSVIRQAGAREARQTFRSSTISCALAMRSLSPIVSEVWCGFWRLPTDPWPPRRSGG